MAESTDRASATGATLDKPKLAFACATSLSVGYAPKAPGTFGSLVGIVVALLTHPISLMTITGAIFAHRETFFMIPHFRGEPAPFLLLVPSLVAILIVGWIGVWSSSRVASFAGIKDPQYVVIDEVSGMHLTLVLGIMPLSLPTHLIHADNASVFALYSALSLLNWKYLLLGFICFRIFDIWKPYPVRQLEKLPRGWGIMADDWMAGIYAAILLRIALHFNLV